MCSPVNLNFTMKIFLLSLSSDVIVAVVTSLLFNLIIGNTSIFQLYEKLKKLFLKNN